MDGEDDFVTANDLEINREKTDEIYQMMHSKIKNYQFTHLTSCNSIIYLITH